VAKAVSESPFPVIICGDFNDTPTSYTYATISKGLTDAFLQSGTGIGKTYVGIFPTLRIDFILLSKELESLQTQTIEKPFSDHYPLISYIRTAKN
jgi:endonuclease/exonuclease/phosphatase family metal-dependent hydrolase